MKARVKAEYRDLFALILKSDPSARRMYKRVMALKVAGGRPEFWGRESGFNTWFFSNDYIFIAMVRHGENDWSLHS